jgi:hypothetical protein
MSKRLLFLSFLVSVFFLFIGGKLIAGETLNGVDMGDKVGKPKSKPSAPAAPVCTIYDQVGGTPGQTVIQVSDTTERMWWLQQTPSVVPEFQLKFVVKLNSSSPLTKQVQKFEFPGGNFGPVITPFGIPFWGGNLTSGPAILKVKDDYGNCTYFFTVIP